MKELIFFTLRDFSKHGGGSLRIKGILNALAIRNIKITLISNIEDHSEFDENINHIVLNIHMTKNEKNYLQLLLSVFPIFFINVFYRKKMKMFMAFFKKNNFTNKEIVFFENIDNSLGYVFKKNQFVFKYINDIHGIAPMEFKEKRSIGLKQKLSTYIKYIIAKKLDKKVFHFADGLIFVSEGMKNYFEKLYPNIDKSKMHIINDGVSKEFCEQKTNRVLLSQIQNQYNISSHEKIIFFAGAFKHLGGVIDLIDAFAIVHKRLKNNRLFLIGEGELMPLAIKKVQSYDLEDKVIFAGTIPYKELKTYQQIADIIVCPDISHPYSEIVPHVKYFDSLVSGKIVINGAFTSVKDINKNQELSINFEPSNITDLSDKIIFCLENYVELTSKYKSTRSFVCNKHLYEYTVEEFYRTKKAQ